MEKWKKYLAALGLSETEARVYLEVLKMGPSPVQEIARTVGLSRVSVYATIDALAKLGLMTSVEKGKKQVYAAEPPERVVALAENKAVNLGAVVKEIKSGIHELKMAQAGEKPIVKMYEGSEAFMAIGEDVLANFNKIDRMCEFGNLDDVNRVYPYENLEPFYKKLAKAKFPRQLIFQSKDRAPRTNEPNKKIKYLDQGAKPFRGDVFFYDDTVWLSGFSSKQMTVMIKSKEIKETVQAAFDILWKALP